MSIPEAIVGFMQENNLQSNMTTSNKLPVVKFRLDNCCEESGENPFQVFRCAGDDFYELGRDYTLIGWCKSSGLSIRPSDGDYAIMLQRSNGLEFWIHCPYDMARNTKIKREPLELGSPDFIDKDGTELYYAK